MHASEVTPEAVQRANELYWHSDTSVNQIAEDLDLSKGALYGAIEPLASGLGCPLCGAEVAFPNRTARDQDSLECPTCDWDGTADETVAPDRAVEALDRESSGSAVVTTGTPSRSAPEPEAPPPAPPIVLPPPGTIALGAMIGGAVGLALVLWARRR